MEQCDVSPTDEDHRWGASFKRMAWAQSRDSWQAPEIEEQSPEELLPTQTTGDKPAETGRIPSKIASWLRDCRTPLGASLDDQSSSPSKGPPRNGCSFEDDLSLGAEANHLQNSSTKPDDPGYSMPAKEKRSQFKQKGRSMNSTGSGKSSGTVSSVSELLDLYEEDPEEILYNLGFGREEPDIASKIPPRFFNSSSGAKGIDIKVYLAAQMQRMELENPNYALTSRFRQTEVLATVANVFSDLYSQVSGRPLQRIATREAEPKEPVPLKENNPALNAVKILKKNLTRPNLLTSILNNAASEANGAEKGNPEPHLDQKPKPPQKDLKKRDSPLPLETVTEESLQGGVNAAEGTSALDNGASEPPDVPDAPVLVSIDKVPDQNDGQRDGSLNVNEEQQKPDRDVCSLLHNPHIASHLLTKPQNSFELEELQSNEDEAVPGTHCISRAGSEHLLRTASQQSDSSGFAEDPSTDSSPYLKVQESSDSCDSETTVTSHGVTTPVALDHPAFERLQGEEEVQAPSSRGRLGLGKEKIPEYVVHQVTLQNIPDMTRQETEGSLAESETQALSERLITDSSSSESGTTVESVDLVDSTSAPNAGTSVDTTPEGLVDSTTKSDGSAEMDPSVPAGKPDPSLNSGPTEQEVSDAGLQSRIDSDQSLSTSERLRNALLRAEQRSFSVCDNRVGRVWIRKKDFPTDQEERTRNPMRRSSSLPTSLPSPTRVVSSLRIQLGGGGLVRHCTPPSYSYRYEDERDEAGSIAEADEYPEEPPSRSRSTHLINQASMEGEALGLHEAPPYPLNVNPNLTRSASSLYSVPADWPMQRLADGPVWSTNSVPDLTQHAIPHSLLRQNRHHVPHSRLGANSPHPMNIPYAHTQSGQYQYAQPSQSPFAHPTPHSVPFSQPNMPYVHPHSAPFGPSAPFHHPYSVHPPQNAPYGSTFNTQGTHYSPYSFLPHSHSASNSLAYGYPPLHTQMPYGHQYNPPFAPPGSSFPMDTPTPPPAVGSTEMQLRRVLHEIRGTVQSLGQSPSVQRDGTPLGTQSPHQAVQPFYEELQMRRQSLNVFRTQMMDLELALMRQQSMVYQHFSSDERREAEQLQRLRSSVRQELQELELQLEDRMLTLNDQLRSAQHSHLCRHPLGMSRGHSIDSLSSSSALRAMEPVTDLLQEQLFLQSELGYDGSFSAADTSVSGRSSRAESPLRSSRTPDHYSPSIQRGGTYRSTVSITPSVPARPGVELSQPSAECQDQNLSSDPSELSAHTGAGQGSVSGPESQPEDRGRGDAQLQQLIHEIKQSLADEIREEIVSKLLAAVSSRSSPTSGRQPPA